MRTQTWAAMAALGAAALLPARAHGQTCTPPSAAIVSPTAAVTPPQGHRAVRLVDEAGAPVATVPAISLTGATWTPTAEEARAIATAQAAAPGRTFFLQWSGAAGVPPCTQRFRVVAPAPNGDPPAADVTPITPTIPASAQAAAQRLSRPGEGGPAGSTAWDEGDCVRAGAQWRQEIRRAEGSDRFTEIVFLESGGVCYRSRDYGVTGDPIYVAVFTDQPEEWDGVQVTYEPCAIESASPSVLVSDRLPSIPSGTQSREWRLRTYPPRTCYNDAVAVTVQGPGSTTARTTVQQAQRYRATLQLGAVFTDLHDHSFGLRPDGAVQRIYDQGPDDRGPEYFASIVLYGLPHYLPSLFTGRRYAGRDPVHDVGFLDRVGGMLGVGLNDPGKQFAAGLTFEVISGVNVTGTWYWAQVPELAGVAENDVFTGNADQIPTRQTWERDFSFGVSLDLRYAASLFTRGS